MYLFKGKSSGGSAPRCAVERRPRGPISLRPGPSHGAAQANARRAGVWGRKTDVYPAVFALVKTLLH